MIKPVGIDSAKSIVAASNVIDLPDGYVVCAALDRILELLGGRHIDGNSGGRNRDADACNGIGASVG